MTSAAKWTGLLVAGMLAGGAAHAALVDRGGGLVYDTDYDITWLQDADYPTTSAYPAIDSNGQMSWEEAKTWAADLVYGGYDDWRLPSAFNPDGSGPCGLPAGAFDCTGSELGHLFYTELGNSAGMGGFTNSGPFVNVRSLTYWNETAAPPDPVGGGARAWVFFIVNGLQYPGLVTNAADGSPYVGYAWAVRDGDVAATVPEPAMLLLLGLGFAVYGALRPRR